MTVGGEVRVAADMVVRADGLRRAGRMDEAIAILRALVEQAPRDAAAWAMLAQTLAAANRPDLAAPAWEEALRLGPRSAQALSGRARALQSLGRPGEAAECFEVATVIDPDGFDARFGLAQIAFDAGELDRAAAQLSRLEAAHGGQPDAARLAARLAVARGEFERARTVVAVMLAAPGLDVRQRADALLLQAEVLDRLGQTGQAFAAARQGKAIQRWLFAQRAASHEGEIAKLSRLATWFETADTRPWATSPPPGAQETAGHVFLVGFPRSGTTLLEQALAGNPRIVALEEAPTLADHYQEFLTSAGGLERLARIDARDAEVWRARYWAIVREHGAEPRGHVFLDKAPAGTLNLPVIAKLFPTARILFAVRDPRDVVLSCAMNAFQMNSMTYAFTDLAETAACYGACMRLAEIYRRVLPLAFMQVRYEALVEDFAGELAAVAAFIDIAYVPTMVDVATTARGRTVRTPSASQVRAGLNRKGLGHWRAYANDLAPVIGTLAPWTERFGYSPD